MASTTHNGRLCAAVVVESMQSGRGRQGTRDTVLIKSSTIDISRTLDPIPAAGGNTVSSNNVQRCDVEYPP